MRKMITFMKKTFPGLLEEYRHWMRLRTIRLVKKRKKMDKKEYPAMISEQYKKRIGHELNWNNPTCYTEKMQWEKLYDENPLKTQYTDKYLVRSWIKKVIGEEYLIPLLGVWNSFDEIDFNSLPNRFVLKTNHGSGTNIIVKDKEKLNLKSTKRTINDWLNTDFGYKTFELHYSKIVPKIIAEEYIETKTGDLQDYKFLCFDGKPLFCWVDIGRYSNHTRNVYDLNWNLQPWNQEALGHYDKEIPKPINFAKMIELATVLSTGFSHVRVDLYNVEGKIYFGEMTFTNGGGFDRILPSSYDVELGKLWKLDVSR